MRITNTLHCTLALALPLWACVGSVRPRGSDSRTVPVAQGGYRVVNVMPRYWRFLDSASGRDSATTRRLFHEIVIAEDTAVFNGFAGGPSDATLASWLRRVTPYTDAMRQLDARIGAELGIHERSFSASFPDAQWDHTEVYFMPWFFVSNAGTGTLSDGRQILIFGVDAIARENGSDNKLAILFHHELFHLYHAHWHPEWNRGTSRGPLYESVWGEGLATYVSGLLNPAATLADVLGERTLSSVALREPVLAKEIEGLLDSTSPEVHRNYMSGSPLRSDLPPRSGYYLGLQIAQRLARTYSLQQLVRLRDPDLRREIDTQLQQIALGVTP